MPLNDREVVRLVRQLVSMARRLRRAGNCTSCARAAYTGAHCTHYTCARCVNTNENCDVLRLDSDAIRKVIYQIIISSKKLNFGRWKKTKLKTYSKGLSKKPASRDVRLHVLLSCSGRHLTKDVNSRSLPRKGTNSSNIAKKVLSTLACRILTSGSLQTVPLLCRMAADGGRYSRLATTLLIQIISILSRFPSQRPATAVSYQVFDRQTSFLSKSCQHSERAANRRTRQLCHRELWRYRARSRETELRIDSSDGGDHIQRPLSPLQLKPDYLPILVGTISVPMMPCPILISPGPVTSMLRSMLQQRSYLVGMALPASQYGTILKVCDCVELADGSFILSTMGRGRFRIVKRLIVQQCLVAKVNMVYDKTPSQPNLPLSPYIEATSKRIIVLFNNFFSKLKPEVKDNIVDSYGPLQKYLDVADRFNNGPAFLWWMTAVLPLSDELKIHLISCESIHKRMVIIQDALIKATVIYKDIHSVQEDTIT